MVEDDAPRASTSTNANIATVAAMTTRRRPAESVVQIDLMFSKSGLRRHGIQPMTGLIGDQT
jgi:hypothetical protein